MRVISAAIAALTFALLAGCGTAPEDTPLGKAHEKCAGEVTDGLGDDSEFEASQFVALEDEGLTLSIGAPSNDEDGDVGEATGNLYSVITGSLTVCTLEELDGPDSILSKMESTTAMMGRQSDDWDDFEVSWSYHPDNGLDATFEQNDD
jgi:hypothetical protein